LPGIYGPDDRGASTIGQFLGKIRSGEEISIFGDGQVLRDFVLTDDLCAVVVASIRDPKDCLLNVASGRSQPLLECVRALERITGKQARFHHIAANPDIAGDLVFEVSKLKATFPHAIPRPFTYGVRALE